MRRRFAVAFVLVSLGLAARPSHAQEGVLPRSEADALLDAGRWPDAEEALYAAVRTRPRDPIARARLGRYLAMKGALRPGLVLIEEAAEFGLPASTTRALAAPIRTLIDWREQGSFLERDSTVVVRPTSTPGALLRLPITRAGARDTVWADLVPRAIGRDSLSAPSPRVGIETIEGLVPSFDVANHLLRLHADPRAPLSAVGRRYPVLRSGRDVRVLLAPGRVRPLAEALRELTPRWWQLDLPHGLLIAR
ncbi:MAG TPA: hypothetical protein VFS59_19800 [Gemmatimonadaceae bacterium]|nr:hypothetical protein [Gemmatimonadaceae bacterium]